MRRLYLSERLKLFLSSKPPLITFLLCLLGFMLSMLSFLVYVDNYSDQIANPDEVDWNVFNEHLSKLEFCIMTPLLNELLNETNIKKIYDPENFKVSNEIKDLVNFNDKTKLESQLANRVNYTYDVTLTVEFSGDMSELEKMYILNGRVNNFLMGAFKDDIDVSIRVNHVEKQLDDNCKKKMLLGQTCSKHTVKGCITLISNAEVFPKTQVPRKCQLPFRNLTLNNSYKSRFESFKETPELTQQFHCSHGTKAKIDYQKDPHLVEFLNEEDKRIIKDNLSTILWGLFVVFLTFILNGIYQTEPNKSGAHFQAIEEFEM